MRPKACDTEPEMTPATESGCWIQNVHLEEPANKVDEAKQTQILVDSNRIFPRKQLRFDARPERSFHRESWIGHAMFCLAVVVDAKILQEGVSMGTMSCRFKGFRRIFTMELGKDLRSSRVGPAVRRHVVSTPFDGQNADIVEDLRLGGLAIEPVKR